MTRTELAQILVTYSSAGLTNQRMAGNVVDAFIESLVEILMEKGSVSIPRFGSLVIASRKGGRFHNARTGEFTVVPAWNTVRFRPHQALKDMCKYLS